MTETLLYKKHVSFYSLKGPIVCCKLRDRWRDIYSERGLLLVPYLLPGARGYQRLYPLARWDALWSATYPSLDSRFSALSQSDRGYHVVSFQLHTCWTRLLWHALIPRLLITAWQLVEAHRVTRNEPKMHVI